MPSRYVWLGAVDYDKLNSLILKLTCSCWPWNFLVTRPNPQPTWSFVRKPASSLLIVGLVVAYPSAVVNHQPQSDTNNHHNLLSKRQHGHLLSLSPSRCSSKMLKFFGFSPAVGCHDWRWLRLNMSVGNGASFDPHLDVRTATVVGGMSLSWQESCLSKGLTLTCLYGGTSFFCKPAVRGGGFI